MKKWISRIIDIFLVLVILLLGYVEVSMLVSKGRNKGVPQAFGLSFLYVVTDSMEIPGDNKSLAPGTGIIIKKTKAADLEPAKQIVDEEGKLIDYDVKSGDVVTFLLKDLKSGIEIPDTHRVIGKEYNEEEGKWYITTMGDNPKAHESVPEGGGGRKETWSEDKLIGKVIHHSKALGTLLVISSPAVAASAGKFAWFFPIAILTPISTIATISIIQAIKKYRKEEKEREEHMLQLMTEAGIDMNDDVAVELFRTKEEIRLEMKEEMEKEKEKARKLVLKEAKKEKQNESKN